MTWNDCDGALKSGLFFSLHDDKEEAVIQIVGEPTPRHGVYNGKPRTQFVFPCATVEGLQVWPVGAKIYKRLRDERKTLIGKPVKVRRMGKAGETSTWYEFVPVTAPAALKKVVQSITEADIEAAIEASLAAGGDNKD